jgi:hypothetical protein
MNPEIDLNMEAGAESEPESDLVSEGHDLLVLDEMVDTDLVLPMWEATGNGEVDSALELIQGIDLEEIHSHHGILTQVHDRLRDVMVNLDR